MLITGRERTPQAGEQDVGRVVEHYALTESELFERITLDQLNGSRPLNDVFFDYDENFLRDDARQVLQRNAQWLAKWPQTTIRIDGHCDERGAEEYNLVLGDRRAVAVRDYLTSLGISPQRIQTVTLGKSRHSALGRATPAGRRTDAAISWLPRSNSSAPWVY